MSHQLVVLDDLMPGGLAQRLEKSWARCRFVPVSHVARAQSFDALVHWGTPWDELQRITSGSRGRLRWVHTWQDGVDELLSLHPKWLGGVTLTNSRGAQARAIAEYVLSRIVHAEWFRSPASISRRELTGRRLAILGYGAVGRAVSDLARAVGLRVMALVRHADQQGAENLTFEPRSRWRRALADASFVVVAVPLTSDTRNLVDATLLGALPVGAVLINVARGAVVDSDALVEALESGRLAAAYLDVTDPEPLPAGHALLRCPNCLVTPHVAGTSVETEARLFEILEQNLEAFCNGAEYRNVVNPSRGY